MVADQFIACGNYAEAYIRGFREIKPAGQGFYCRSIGQADDILTTVLRAEDAILFKGSHGTNLYELAKKVSLRRIDSEQS